jgi:16S rRNA (guanine527-N7)-methyltransferase
MISSEEAARDWLRELPACDDAAFARLEQLASLLTAENQRQNLVSEASLAAVWQRHIADSAQLLLLAPGDSLSPWLDLGSGAGFPGLVIAALHPEWEVILVESRGLRAAWLEQASLALGLKHVRVVATQLQKLETAPMAVISARAFAPLGRLLDLSARFSTNDTLWLLPKGRSAHQELQELQGWQHMFHVKQSLTDPEAGIVTGTLQARKGRKS